MEKAIELAANFFINEDCFCLLCHKDLDGDTVGSAYAIFYALRQLGKKVVVRTYFGEISSRFSFLYPPEEERIAEFKPNHYVTVDVSGYNLLEKDFDNYKFSLCIDHHVSNYISADIMCVDEKRAAACEIVYLILQKLNIYITKNIANCLYTGIATDTGCFKFNNTTSFTHKMASDLIDFGAEFKNINFEMFEKKSHIKLELEKYVLNSLEYYFEGKVVFVFIDIKAIEKIGATKEDLSFLPSVSSAIEGAVVSITVRQEKDLLYNVSLRSQDEFDSAAFCKNFGGGGHKAAAGCVINGDEEIVRKKLLKALQGRV